MLDETEALSANRRSSAFITRPNKVNREPKVWLAQLKDSLSSGHAVFVKASRAMKFENVAGAL